MYLALQLADLQMSFLNGSLHHALSSSLCIPLGVPCLFRPLHHLHTDINIFHSHNKFCHDMGAAPLRSWGRVARGGKSGVGEVR